MVQNKSKRVKTVRINPIEIVCRNSPHDYMGVSGCNEVNFLGGEAAEWLFFIIFALKSRKPNASGTDRQT